jgi:hypothetical protein
MIKTKSVHSPIDPSKDGMRILATRFRGRRMPKTRFDVWMANLAPSEALLKSFQSNKIAAPYSVVGIVTSYSKTERSIGGMRRSKTTVRSSPCGYSKGSANVGQSRCSVTARKNSLTVTDIC